MKLLAHFMVSFLLVIALYPFFGNYAALVFLTGFFIDLDHYPVYFLRTGNFNPFKANEYFIKNKLRNVLCVFHTVEVFALVVGLSLLTDAGSVMLLGLVSHHAMDFYNESRIGRNDAKAKSLILYLLGR